MKRITPFIVELFQILNKKYNYAVLRSFENLPDKFDSHDIDIIFDKKQYSSFKNDLENLITKHDLKIILFNQGKDLIHLF